MRDDKTPSQNRLRKFLRHTFLPVRGNGHHPHILKREVLLGTLAVVLLFEIAVLAQGLILFKNSSYLASVLPAVVASLTNDQRTENDLSPLAVSPLLTQAAQNKANDMAAKGYFSHISPDGTLPWHWFDLVGYQYQFAGENLAVNFNDSTDVVNAWMASPMHRANILKQDYTEEGIGMATGMYQGKETIFVVQFFGRPESDALGLNSSSADAVSVVTQKPNPAPSELMTTSATTSPIAIEVASTTATGTPAVLGVETGAAVVSDAAAADDSSPSFFQKLLASPFTTSSYVFAGIFALMISILVTGVRYRKRLPRLSATLGGLSVAIVVLGIAILNEHYLSSSVKVDQVTRSSEPAAAIEATSYR